MSAVRAPAVPEIRGAAPCLAIADRSAADLFAPGRLRALGVKSAWSLADQGLTALTGFCVTFLLARWLAPEVYGAYAIAFAGCLFVGGLHNVLVLEPMSVIGPSRHAARLQEYFRAQLAIHGVFVGICSAVTACGAALVWHLAPEGALAGAIAGSAVALPSLLSLFLARRMCYVRQRPFTATLGSGCCLVLAVVGLYMLRHFERVSPFSVFVLVGAASLAGSCLVFREVGVGTFHAAGVTGDPTAWASALRENWAYGRWLVGSTILYSVSGQVQMFLAAAFLGLGAAGILRAMMLPASAMTQVVTAASLLVLPGFSYDFGRGLAGRIRQKAMILSGVLCGAGICFSVMLWMVAERAEHILFADKYAAYAWLMPMLSLVPAVNGLTMGFSTALRASQRPHLDLLANAIAAPIAVVSAVSLIHWWGLAGAAASLVTGFVAYMGVNCWAFYAAPGSEIRPEIGARGAAR